MKLSGGILVLASVMFSGVLISLRLKRRSVFLGETVLFVSQISMEIEYVNLPVFEILDKISSGDCCKSLDFVAFCLESLKKGEDFLPSWKNALDSSQLPLKKEEREKLINLGSLLGTSDARGQGAILSLYKEYFVSYHNKALEEYEKYGKMCITLGAVSGMGIFILLM